MPRSNDEKKAIETRVLIAARKAGIPIPFGETPGEEPDFCFTHGTLGIEIRELLKPGSSNFGIVPAEAESYHQEIVRLAQQQYYAAAAAIPVTINLYFANARGKRRDKRDMARTLTEFIKAHLPGPNDTLNFSGRKLPEGFGSMSIWRKSRDWWCGEGGSYSVSDIREALTSSITAKNRLVSDLPKEPNPRRSGVAAVVLYVRCFSRNGDSLRHRAVAIEF